MCINIWYVIGVLISSFVVVFGCSFVWNLWTYSRRAKEMESFFQKTSDLQKIIEEIKKGRKERMKDKVIQEILDIVKVFHEQNSSPGGVCTPGGLEHMWDVWDLFLKWEEMLNEGNKNE